MGGRRGFATWIIVALAIASTVGGPLPATSAHAASPWGVGIVAVDPATHEVGAAGASCGPDDASTMATIAPGRGTAVALPVDAAVSNRLARALPTHDAAGTVARVRAATPSREARVFAAATIGAIGASVVGTRVVDGGEWIGSGAAIVTVGVAPSVLTEGGQPLGTHGSLAARLVAALQATAAGHDCGGRASAAFVIVAGPTADPLVPARGLGAARARQRHILERLGGTLASDELEDRLLAAGSIPRRQGPHAPEVDLSLLQSPGGFDAVTLLQQAYDQTHPSASDSTATATASPTPTVGGGTSHHPRTFAYLVIAALLLGGAAAMLAIARRLRRLDRE
jgi:Family of unknown function (DUF1028)